MKNKKPIFWIWIFVLFFSGSACFADGVAVLIQQSPVGAGQITPGLGVGDYCYDEVVKLNTIANSGYHFVYWLGDVADPTSSATNFSVTGPKIIIAVFERDSFELESVLGAASQGPQILRPTLALPAGQFWHIPIPPEGLPDPDIPIVIVPEPSTVAIMAAGLAIVLVIYRRQHHLKNS